MGVWSNNFTAAFFVSFIATDFVPDSAVVAQLCSPMAISKKIFRQCGTSRSQMAFKTKYPNFLLFYFAIF